MANLQYILAPNVVAPGAVALGVYINQTETNEYILGPGNYINETIPPTPPTPVPDVIGFAETRCN
jgi:hypothetical protein